MSARRLLIPLGTVLATLLLAVPALADEGGEGLYGKADDKVITNFGFGLMFFFLLLVLVLSLIQNAFERRKQK